MIIESPNIVQNPIVSIVICTYNQEHYIRQTIDSVLQQECNFPYEIIIGEDCGTDGTRKICEEYQQKYPEKIKLLLFETNGGLVHNWLSCIKEAKGKYIAGCAGDDYWHNPHKQQLQVDYMEAHATCGVVHSDFDQLNVLTNRITKSYYKTKQIKMKNGFVQNEVISGSLKITAPTICIRKEFFDKYIPVKDYLRLNFQIEDWPTLVILSYYCEFYYLPISTITYRVGQESLSRPQSYEKINNRFKHEENMIKYLHNLFPNQLIYDEKYIELYKYRLLLNLAYKKIDYRSAKTYSEIIQAMGTHNIKVRCANNYILFHAFVFGKKLKSLLTN